MDIYRLLLRSLHVLTVRVSGWLKSLDEAHSNPGLHAAAGPALAEECATLVYDVTR